MTPERQKWWKIVSISEKYLKLELGTHRNIIKEYKKTLNIKLYRKIISKLNIMEEYYMIQDAKDKIVKAKIISNAIKHKLERGGNAEMTLDYVRCSPRVWRYGHCREFIFQCRYSLAFAHAVGKS